MLFEAKFEKSGKFWAIEAPLLGVVTQGKTKADALFMLGDAIEALINKEGFKASVTETGDGEAIVESTDSQALLAMALRELRRKSGQSLAEVSAKLGQSSRNAYARYEQGKAVPSADKLSELLGAVAPGYRFVIRGVAPGITKKKAAAR